MCLRVIDKKKPKATGTGWKVFRKQPNGLISLNGYYSCERRPTGMWLTAVDALLKEYGKPSDKPENVGWHIFLNKRDAVSLAQDHARTNAVVLPVKYRGARVSGEGDGYYNDNAKIVVAKEMFILPEEK